MDTLNNVWLQLLHLYILHTGTGGSSLLPLLSGWVQPSRGRHVPHQNWHCPPEGRGAVGKPGRGYSGQALGRLWAGSAPTYQWWGGSTVIATLSSAEFCTHFPLNSAWVSLNCLMIQLPLNSEWISLIFTWPGCDFYLHQSVYLHHSVCISPFHSFALKLVRIFFDSKYCWITECCPVEWSQALPP